MAADCLAHHKCQVSDNMLFLLLQNFACSYILCWLFDLLLSRPLQVIESLAREDTDIKPEHIALIKQLIQREEREEDRKQSVASP